MGIIQVGSKAESMGIPRTVTRKFRVEGHIESIAENDVWYDVWEGGAAVIPTPVGASQLALTSSSVDDSDVGIGGQEVRLHYLNGAGALTHEDLVMNGQALVPTVATDITHVMDLHNIRVGSNIVSVGDIDVVNLADNVIYCRTAAGGNKSMSTLRKLPTGSTMFITQLLVSGDTKGTEVLLRSDANDELEVFPGVWLYAVPVMMTDGPVSINFSPALEIPSGASIKVSARKATGNGLISVFINGWIRL